MKRPLRFCMVTTFYPPYHFGGDGVFVHRLANELAQRGHEVEVVHCRDAYHLLHPEEPVRSYENHAGVTIHTLHSSLGAVSPLLTQQVGAPLLKARKLRRILEGGCFDVIHFHNVSLIGGPGVLAYGNAVKLYTMHEYWLVCPMHILFKDGREACTKPDCLRCTVAHRRPPQLWRYTGAVERAVKHVDAFIAPSAFVGEMHAARGLHIPTVHIPMFIPDPPDGNVSVDVPNEGRPYFLYVGRLEKLKGLQDVIPIFERYDQADLLVVGDGNYRVALERLAGGNPRVRFTGAQPYEELARLYRHARALLVPSLCYETFGQIVLEAFSMHTPVLARNIGALRELVLQSGGGLLFSFPDELKGQMEDLRADSGLRARLAEQGSAYYRAHGTVEHHLERYLGLIEALQQRREIVLS
ncbi:MAG TPA: glycosyltransferase family 4 protein [Rhodothermales bacterium]|nr:glycosyltransferase family 4 protein [Rhodothermales bacterium]